MPILSLDNYDDQFENQLESEGKFFPTEVWNIIKEFNAWTEDRRGARQLMAESSLENIYKFCSDYKGTRKGRQAPFVRIGDEINFLHSKSLFERACGKVIKINKASIDILPYATVRVSSLIWRNSSRKYWKKDIVGDKPIRWIGSYEVGDNNGKVVWRYVA